MVERVVMAYRAKLIEMDDDTDINGPYPPVDAPIEPGEIELARAAIEAMREPTVAMARRGSDVSDDEGPNGCAVIWQSMIDAALSPAQRSSIPNHPEGGK